MDKPLRMFGDARTPWVMPSVVFLTKSVGVPLRIAPGTAERVADAMPQFSANVRVFPKSMPVPIVQ
jgi:hypothetical protein